MKKFAKLNLDHDLAEQLFEDEKVGPCKPGCAIWKLLGRGNNPLALPIPETVVVGPNNHVKLLSNDPTKGFIVQEDMRFDNQSDRDDFVAKCLNKFVTNSKPILSDPPEPLYARFVAVQKKPCLKAPRIFITQQSDFLVPIALQAQVLEIADNNLQQCIIQKFIKSRGRRPGIYRLFWRRASNETGAAEGWNITTISEEFRQPDMITLEKPKSTNDDAEENEVDEVTFKRQTTKFIATYLRAGALQLEQEQAKDALSEQINKLTEEVQNLKFKPSSAPLVKQTMQKASFSAASIHGDNEDHLDSPDKTFLTAAAHGGAPTSTSSPRTGHSISNTSVIAAAAAAAVAAVTAASSSAATGSSPGGSHPVISATVDVAAAQKNANGSSFSSLHSPLVRGNTLKRMVPPRRHDSMMSVSEGVKSANADFSLPPEGVSRTEKTSEDYFTMHSAKEIDELFLKGMTSRLYMSSSDRTKALLINAKAISSAGSSVSASITNNDGELSEEKCKRLSATRVSSAALEKPISLIAQLTHWMEVSLRDLYNLQVFISEAVVDFIKDDQGHWWFINLKSFKLTEDSLPKVQAWHAIYIQRKPERLVIKQRPLSAKERKAKHEAEAGVMCALCGVYYMLNTTVELPETMIESHPSRPDRITHVPAYGYQMALQAARLVVTLLQKYGVPPTLFTKSLLKVNDLEDINSRSVKQLLHDPVNANVLLHKDSGGEVVVCCYRCFGIYSKSSLIHDRIHYLNGLMGIQDAQYWESKDDKFLRGGNYGASGGNAAMSAALGEARSMDVSKPQVFGSGASRRPRSAISRSLTRPQSAASVSADGGTVADTGGRGQSSLESSPLPAPVTTSRIVPGSNTGNQGLSSQLQKDLRFLAELIRLIKERPVGPIGVGEISARKLSASLGGSQRPLSASSARAVRHSHPGPLLSQQQASSTKYCSYHSIPYGVMHWRMLIMFHYVILEDSDKLNKWIDDVCLSYQSATDGDSDPEKKELNLPRYFAVQYSIGQQTVHVPFLVNHKKLAGKSSSEIAKYILLKKQQQRRHQRELKKLREEQQDGGKKWNKKKGKSPIQIFKKQQIIPIQECRLHCLCSKTADMVDFVKDFLVTCRIFSLQESSNGSNNNSADTGLRGRSDRLPFSRAMGSTAVGTAAGGATSSPSNPRITFLQSTTGSTTPPPASSSSIPKQSQRVQEEGCFSLFLNKLKVHKGSQALLDGLEKQDMLITLSTASLGNISVKASVAIVRDDVLPSNLNAVETFLVEGGTIYHPPASYVPSGLTLPEAWLSMMLDTKSVAAARKADRKASQARREAEEGSEMDTSDSDLSAAAEEGSRTGAGGKDRHCSEEDSHPSSETSSEGSSDSEDSSINPAKDMDDNLIERMLDRQLHKEKEARKEILIQRKMAEERQNRIKEQLQNDRMARLAGEQAMSSSQRPIAPNDKRRWSLLNNTISATRKISSTVLNLRAQNATQGKDGQCVEDLPADAKEEGGKTAFSRASHHSSEERRSTGPTGEESSSAGAEERSGEASNVPALSPEDKSKRRSRVIGQLAKFLREKANEVEDPAAASTSPPSSLSPVPSFTPMPASSAQPPISSSTAPNLSRPSSQGENAMTESLAASAKARRQRNYSMIANNMLKFTQFQSNAYSPALQQHYEGIEAFLRVFEERMIEMESTRVRSDNHDEKEDDLEDRQTYLSEMMAEHGLDSRAVLSELSSLVHTIQEEFDEYDALIRAHIAAQVAAASHSAHGSGNDLNSLSDNATVATSTTSGNATHGYPPTTSVLSGIGEEDESGANTNSQSAGENASGTMSPAPGAVGEGRGRSPSLSFFTVARVMVKHSDVQNKISRAVDEGGGGGGSSSPSVANAETDSSTGMPATSRRSIASVGHRASIKDLMLLRGSSSTRKTSLISSRGSISMSSEVDLRKDAHNEVIASRNADALITDAEICYISSTLIDAMTLTLRQLTIMEYLPSHITWPMLKPLIIESLPTFLMER